MRIYIANLGKYNKGELVGAWFTLPVDYDEMAELFAPLCTKVAPITTAESFEDLAQ